MDFLFIIKTLFLGFWSLFQNFLFILIFPLGIFIFIIIKIIWNIIILKYIYHLPRKIKGLIKPIKKTSFFKNLFVLFPKQLVLDAWLQDPNAFREFGIHIAVGKQGSGKTMTVVYLLQEWAKMYPKMETYTNMCYEHENGELRHWKDLIERDNGIYGVANVVDEIQTWFSNSDSKNVPSEMLSEICQQRKQKKAMMGTVQVFSRLARPFREQVFVIYVPYTFFGCLTVVRKTKPEWYNSDTNSFRKFKGMFIFAHTKKLRESYDTYKKIEKYKDMEFSDGSSSIVSQEGQAPPVVELSFANFEKKRK